MLLFNINFHLSLIVFLYRGSNQNRLLSFKEQPSFLKLLPENKSLTVNETGNIELKCLVRGKPTPNVTWTKDGTSKIIGEYDVFTKNNANRSDKGTYRCRASNGVGRILEAVFSVDVNCKYIELMHMSKIVIHTYKFQSRIIPHSK